MSALTTAPTVPATCFAPAASCVPCALRRYGFELTNVIVGIIDPLMVAGETGTLRKLLSEGLLADDATRSASVANVTTSFGWSSDDGHCNSKEATWHLDLRGLVVLPEEPTAASRAALREPGEDPRHQLLQVGAALQAELGDGKLAHDDADTIELPPELEQPARKRFEPLPFAVGAVMVFGVLYHVLFAMPQALHDDTAAAGASIAQVAFAKARGV